MHRFARSIAHSTRLAILRPKTQRAHNSVHIEKSYGQKTEKKCQNFRFLKIARRGRDGGLQKAHRNFVRNTSKNVHAKFQRILTVGKKVEHRRSRPTPQNLLKGLIETRPGASPGLVIFNSQLR
jgi:hypothetical protein